MTKKTTETEQPKKRGRSPYASAEFRSFARAKNLDKKANEIQIIAVKRWVQRGLITATATRKAGVRGAPLTWSDVRITELGREMLKA